MIRVISRLLAGLLLFGVSYCYGDFSGLQFENYNKKNSELPIDAIYSVVEDKDEFIWIATEYGLRRFNGIEFETLYEITGKDFGPKLDVEIKQLFFDSKNNLWIATIYEGVYKLDLQTFTLQEFNGRNTNEYSLTPGWVRRIFEDTNNNVWISTKRGINKYNLLTERMTTIPNSELFPEDYDINISGYSAWENIICIGTSAGIFYFNTKSNTVTKFRNIDYNTLQRKIISALHYDGTNLWIGIKNKLYYYNFESDLFSELKFTKEYEKGLYIYSINSDSTGILWLGTDYGLVRYDIKRKLTKLYTTYDNLSNNIVTGILADNQNNLWISTFNGLNKFNYLSEEFTTFYIEDGLPDNEFDTGKAYKAKSGRMYFAGPSGITYFKPENIKINNKSPSIILSKFTIADKNIHIGTNKNPLPLGKKISDAQHIELNHKQNDFKISFVALDYHSPKRIQYKYKLNGYKNDWIETDYKNRTAQYANLNPGTYTLHIKAGNHHNVWNEEGRKLHITILPPPWKTWWAYTLYILTALLFIYLFYQYRTRQLQQRA